MKERKPSQTASLVAFARALANEGYTGVPGFEDPIAKQLLPRGWRALFDVVLRSWRKIGRKALEPAISQLDVIPLRVAMIDAELDRAVANGCRQVVILGAGLDTRAFRLPSLAETAVYEVDHPATQAYKRRKTFALRPISRSYGFVAVDFEKDSLLDRLASSPCSGEDPSPFDPAQPTLWLWEGVVMYLSDSAVRATLREIAAASPAGARLIVNYHEPISGRRHPALRALLALWGEPQVGNRSRDAMHDELRTAGFVVESDTAPSDWAVSLGARRPSGETARIARIAVARRDASTGPVRSVPPRGLAAVLQGVK